MWPSLRRSQPLNSSSENCKSIKFHQTNAKTRALQNHAGWMLRTILLPINNFENLKKHKMYQISLDVWQQMNGLISRRCRRPSAQQKYLGTFGSQRAPKRHCNDLARLKPLLRFSNPICVCDNDLAQSCVATYQNADSAACQNILGQVLASKLPKLKFL